MNTKAVWVTINLVAVMVFSFFISLGESHSFFYFAGGAGYIIQITISIILRKRIKDRITKEEQESKEQ